MMTIRSHDQFNTTIYSPDDRYRGIKNGRRVLFANPSDVKLLGVEAEIVYRGSASFVIGESPLRTDHGETYSPSPCAES